MCTPIPTDVEKLVNELPKVSFWKTGDLSRYEGFWLRSSSMKDIITFRSTFHVRDDDVLLASTMKTGTTWLKALALCIMEGRKSDQSQHDGDILTLGNPHFHVPTIEAMSFATKTTPPPFDIYDASSAPRLFHTHLPYAVLPDSITNNSSACKIVCIARDPKDVMVSMWHFYNEGIGQTNDPFPLEKAFKSFCSGVCPYGPFFDHVAEYWQESQKRPKKILFVKYEELKGDTKGQVSRIAEFLGRPFKDEKEVEEVVWRCSLERLKGLEVNKSGSHFNGLPNKSFFRKGEVGDWKNYFTPEMEEKINQLSHLKFQPIGLFF